MLLSILCLTLPFVNLAKDQNMVDAKLFKGKAKVLTSARAREIGTVDLEMQISADEYREM